MDLSKLLNDVTPEETKHYGPLPKGKYDVKIEAITPRSNDSGWKALGLQLRVFGANFNNAVLFDQLSIAVPSSEQAQNIGLARLKAISTVLGLTDTDAMIGKFITVTVGIKHDDHKNEEINIVYGYTKYEGSEQSVSTKAAITNSQVPF